MTLIDELQELRQRGLDALSSAADLPALEAARVAYLGKKSELTATLRGLGQLASDARASVGQSANELRAAFEEAYQQRMDALSREELDARIAGGRLDVSLPGRARPLGTQHLINAITEEVSDIFYGLGYRLAEGPEVEDDFHNFTALNHSPMHPARSASDTFYVRDLSEEGAAFSGPEPSAILMRTHTSPVQIHVLRHQEPPLYIISPGKVYRRDISDPTHLPQFTQMEGLAIDEHLTFAGLKGTLDYVVKKIFGEQRRTRFRPHFFPFTEPSAEVDVSCGVCGGEGCRFCKQTGWIEILGCGMVDPNVLINCGIDPERYQGFAFGMGVERIAALRYDLPDIRLLIEGDMRFLRQF